MTAQLIPLPLATVTREWAYCWRSGCAVALVPLFSAQAPDRPTARLSGEWHLDDARVWRLTAYARVLRKRQAGGMQRPVARARWTLPANWNPVVVQLPCVVACPECGAEQVVRWTRAYTARHGSR
jgi:hypothetical protein